ncbi:MAG: TatD family hydrolase, partial [Acidobacteria bacterium]|nr:TatD family hydrolase [Acidobacteriota bacterium]
ADVYMHEGLKAELRTIRRLLDTPQHKLDEASAVIDMGCKISFARPLLRLPELQDVAARIPLDAIVLETDSFPQPFKKNREKWTEPRDIPLVAQKVAELRGIDVSEVMAATTENALSMLGARGEHLAARLGA